jgi:lambda family phage portal protein
VFERMRAKFARLIAPPRTSTRMYQAAKQSRLTSGFGTASTSSDAELASSLRALRDRSRALIRDAAYAKRGRDIVVNNVIGSGVGMQAGVMSSRTQMRESVNDAIESAWERWCVAESCHTGGAVHFADMERMIIAQVFEAGEVFIRKHRREFGSSKVPLALEIVESERLADDLYSPAPSDGNNSVRMGIECDQFGRPVAYFIRERHPSELRNSRDSTVMMQRVPAADIIHLKLTTRWPQTRGEPWLHGVARKLNDMDGYSEAEIVAARGAANYMATIETTDETYGDLTETGEREVVLEPGTVERLGTNEKLNFVSPNRPNAAMDPFMRLMLREVAAGIGVSYESLSRDYSQSNYSSSRLALLDDRDLWKALQQWYIRSFREPLHREWLMLTVMAGSIPEIPVGQFAADMDKFSAVSFKPRGWSWIDPTKEVAAYNAAIQSGLTTRADVISQTGCGMDIEDVDDGRRRELDAAAAKGLEYETDPEIYTAEAKAKLKTADNAGKVAAAANQTPNTQPRALSVARQQ